MKKFHYQVNSITKDFYIYALARLTGAMKKKLDTLITSRSVDWPLDRTIEQWEQYQQDKYY